MVMEETERNLREKIEQEAKNTLKKTMWEGYANDILTGLQKNPGVQPDRPISVSYTHLTLPTIA